METEVQEKGYATFNGHGEMKAGDLVFVYHAAPRSAIIGIYRVRDHPRFDPWGGWDGFWVDLVKVCDVPDITLGAMRQDGILEKWSVVRRRYGVRTEPIPHSVYNALLLLIPKDLQERHGLKAEPVAACGNSGEFASEAEFEDKVVAPLLRRWGFDFQGQHTCVFRFGSGDHSCRVDYLIKDERGQLTLVEDKIRILNDVDLLQAVRQARSYALQLGLSSFVVGAPEGFWLYRLRRNVESLVLHVPSEQISVKEEELRSAILRLRS
jgi:hypothetical protein